MSPTGLLFTQTQGLTIPPAQFSVALNTCHMRELRMLVAACLQLLQQGDIGDQTYHFTYLIVVHDILAFWMDQIAFMCLTK